MLRDHSVVSDPRLDRLVQYDERSKKFPLCATLNSDERQPRSRRWAMPIRDKILNQGKEGACVAFAITNELKAKPVPIKGLNDVFARQAIYWPAQEIDDWPGGSYPGAEPLYEGTSVLAGVKTAAKLGFYTEYRWAFSENELALGISYQGPAVVGVPWYAGMLRTDDDDYINVTGTVQGGHAICVLGIDVDEGCYIFMNSWGGRWGNRGRGRIRRTDMARLLHENGEACIVTGRAVPTL